MGAWLLHGDADTDRDMLEWRVCRETERMRINEFAQPVGRLLGAAMVCTRHDHQKLFAPNSCEKIFRAQIVLQQRREFNERGIACGMAKDIVHALEVIHINDHDSAALARSLAVGHCLGKLEGGKSAVVESRQRVCYGGAQSFVHIGAAVIIAFFAGGKLFDAQAKLNRTKAMRKDIICTAVHRVAVQSFYWAIQNGDKSCIAGARVCPQVGQKAQSSFGRICLNFYDEHIRALASPLIKQPAFFAGLDQAIRGFAQRGAPCFGACGRRRGDGDAGGRHEAAWRFTEAERLGHALCEQCVFTAVMAAQD